MIQEFEKKKNQTTAQSNQSNNIFSKWKRRLFNSKILEKEELVLPEFPAEVTPDEIYAVIGLLLLFGFLKKNDVDVGDIWDKNSVQYCDIAVGKKLII